jgi:asparagine synthase (glutamine-hydrolysing)
MCGIVGIVGMRAARRAVSAMNDCIAHRGRDGDAVADTPDQEGEVIGAFGHRRLSVIDLSDAGGQPMATADGRLLIVFNGEIYNYAALRADLVAAGALFRGHSDTEVILEGWKRHGSAFLSELRGMFAFVIWDSAAGELALVRDQFGIKPLYVARRADAIAFGSELKALIAGGFGERTIDARAVSAYLALGSIPEPLAIVSDARPLPAGIVRRIRFRNGRVVSESDERFALPLEASAEPAIVRMDDAADLVRTALRDSVAHHMVSDVPVGLFLSGGIDSSAVVALAAEATGRALDTFTVVFSEARFSEAGPARAVATRYATRHEEILLSDTDFLDSLPSAFAAMDQPSLDGLNTYVVSRAVHNAGLKVVLSGLGGDELFSGYASFRRARKLHHLWATTRTFHPMVARVANAGRSQRADKLSLFFAEQDLALGAYRASRALFGGRGLAALTGQHDRIPVEAPPPGLSLLQRVSWYEVTGYMRSVLLRDSDVFSMAHHLELRVPFVDREVAASSLRISDELKLRGGGKAVLVEAVRDLLPREVWDRPKQGFTLPFAEWMRGPLTPDIDAALTSATRLERVGLRPAGVRAVWRDFLDGRGAMSWSRPWALYTLVRWAETVDASVAPASGAPLAMQPLAV